LDSIEEVVEKSLAVLASRPSALVTDVDGTLSHIVPGPQDAVVSIEIKEALRVLLPRLDLLAVVTGRESAVARRMVGVEGVTYVGSYAIGPAKHAPSSVTSDIRAAREAVLPYLPRLAGVTMELKDISFALHYRNAEDSDGTRARLIALLEPIAHSTNAKLMEGKQVIEVVPWDLPDKGTSFNQLLEGNDILGAVFAGDDLADAAIFREIRRRRTEGLPGLAIGVIDDETPIAVREAADVQIEGVDAVEAVLVELADRLSLERAPLA
jgi:trehalose 6-phosphate phosphatase